MSVVIVEGRRFQVPSSFTLGEARDMKQISGLDVLELEPALQRGDAQATAAFLFVCMRRVDPDVKLEDLWELDLSRIEFQEEAANEEGEVRPPALSPEPPPERRPSASGSGAGSSGPDAAEPSSGMIPDVSGIPV